MNGLYARKPNLTIKAMTNYLAAAIMSMMIAQLNVTIDGIITSHLVGSNALSAINLYMPLNLGVYALLLLLGIGATIVAAKALGARKCGRASELRWNKDGQIEYMGRIDNQVKLRGFRIELGEIESKALGIEGIRQAVCEVKNVNGTEHLVLYYTADSDSTLAKDDVRNKLQLSSLAEYMVPDVYIAMDTLPLTANGKVNRRYQEGMAHLG